MPDAPDISNAADPPVAPTNLWVGEIADRLFAEMHKRRGYAQESRDFAVGQDAIADRLAILIERLEAGAHVDVAGVLDLCRFRTEWQLPGFIGALDALVAGEVPQWNLQGEAQA
jgi:hypothetical protein